MTDARPRVPILPIIACLGAALFGGLTVGVLAARKHTEADHGPQMTDAEISSIAADMEVAPFQGVDHRGEPIDESVLRGHWTVVSFGFTRCTLVCPMLHGEIYRMSEKLADHDVRFLTISVDPDHDTVEQMASYVKPWGVKRDSWTFARVDAPTLSALLAGLKMAPISSDSSQLIVLPDGSKMPNLHHPTRFFVVGPDAKVRGLWRGTDPTDVDALVRWVLNRVF